MKATLLLFLLIFIQACNTVESDPDLLIKTEKQSYPITDQLAVNVTFENNIGSEISIHNAGCGFPAFMLERFENNKWNYSGGPICVAIAIPPTKLKSGSNFQTVVSMYAEDHIVSGTYRMKFYLSTSDGFTTLEPKYLYSNSFNVVKQ